MMGIRWYGLKGCFAFDEWKWKALLRISRGFHAHVSFQLGTSVPPSPLLFLLHSSFFFQITSLEAQAPWIHLALSLVYLYPFPRASTCLRSNLMTTNHWVHWPGYIKNCSISASWALKFSPPCYSPTWGKRLIVWLGKMSFMMILRGHQPSRGCHTKGDLSFAWDRDGVVAPMLGHTLHPALDLEWEGHTSCSLIWCSTTWLAFTSEMLVDLT